MEATKKNRAIRKWANTIKRKAFILAVIRFTLVALWVPVAVDKLWNLAKFHSTLLRQPFPDWWADILFWLLPLLELAAAVLVAWPNHTKRVRQGLALSTLLMLGFTLFILFGVLGWYAQRPCGCGSVISGLSWEQHLWLNIAFLLISILGLWLTRDKKRQNPSSSLSFRRQEESHHTHTPYLNTVNRLFKQLFPNIFAVFRRKAVKP